MLRAKKEEENQTGNTYKYSTPIFHSVDTLALVLLSVFTLGLYENYWHYRNWKIIKAGTGSFNISPILRGIFYPFFIPSLVSQIKGSSDLACVKRGLIGSFFAVVYLLLSLSSKSLGESVHWFFFFAPVLPLALLQNKNNEINEKLVDKSKLTNSLKDSLKWKSPDKRKLISSSGPTVKFIPRKQFVITSRFGIEFVCFVIVLGVCTTVAFNHGQQALMKAKLSETFIFAPTLKTELGEYYSIKGQWPESNDYEYLVNPNNSVVTKSVFSTKDGGFHMELHSPPEFRDKILSFALEKPNQHNPYHMNIWSCKKSTENNGLSNLTTVSIKYLPFLCRG